MKDFLEAIERDSALKAKIQALNEASGSTPADFIALAAEYGFTLTEADFVPAPASGELDDDELDAVAGGGKCACFFGGAGARDNNDWGCVCIAGGGGKTSRGKVRCVCPMVGGGKDT